MVTYPSVILYERAAFRKSNGPPITYQYYEEGDLHRPYWPTSGGIPPTYLDPALKLHELTNITPKKGREYSEMEVPISFTSLDNLASTLKAPRFLMIRELNSYVIFGWIDDAIPIATKGPNANTLIRWHPDYWLTYCAMAWMKVQQGIGTKTPLTFGQGRVKRGPATMARPDPSAPRRWVYKNSISLKSLYTGDYTGNWAIFLISNNTGTWSSNKLAMFPIGGTITGSGNCPTRTEIFNGTIITMLNTTSDKILGAWFSPVPPGIIASANVVNGGGKYWYEIDYRGTTAQTAWISVSEYTTSDTRKAIVLDQLGNAIATLPWGITFNRLKLQVDIGVNGAQLIIGFIDYDPTDPTTDYAPVETDGRSVSMPLAAIPLFSNAMSDYVFSGQRSYDMEYAQLQAERTLWSGVANTGSSAIGGAIAGSAAAPGVGTVAGAVAGASSSLIGSAIGFAIGAHYDVKAQEAVDKLTANQAGSVVQYGGGDYAIESAYGACVVIMDADAVSKAELEGEQGQLGYICDAYTSNAGTLIANGGGLRIEGLQIDGDISPEGKASIQALFARGVHIDIIS